jgi:hypothetical protein
LGIARRLELRFETDGFLRESGVEPPRTGFADVSVGAKIKVSKERQIWPSICIIPSLSLPTGTGSFTSSGYDPTLNLAWGKELPRGFDASGNVKFASVTEGAQRFVQRVLSVSFGHGLFAGTQGYWEAYRISPVQRDGGKLWVFDTGLTHMLGAHAQVDIEAGHSLNPNMPAWFIGAGLSVRTSLWQRAR